MKAARLNEMIADANRLASFWYCPDHPQMAVAGCLTCEEIAADLEQEREEQHRQEHRIGNA